MSTKLRIGFIPLVDAAAVILAADCGFADSEGLNIELIREVSWSNVRDKLNIGLFDAAHMLSPVAIASSLGVGHVRVPLIAPINLGLNGNAITVSPRLHAALAATADGALTDPKVSSRAFARVVADRKAYGLEPLAFGMTFPFSNHNYQLRFWMAAGGVDPDEDVRLVVLPPPYMVESMANGHVDGFCVGAPWNSAAVNSGVGHILHFGCDIVARMSEKVLAVRKTWADENPDTVAALIRALARASAFADDPAHVSEVSRALARRLSVDSEIVMRSLTGRLVVAPDGAVRTNADYLVIGRDGANRPNPVQAIWLYSQIARWGQAPLLAELAEKARNVFRSDLFDAALGLDGVQQANALRDGIGAFAGPEFDASDPATYLAAWSVRRSGRPRLSIVN